MAPCPSAHLLLPLLGGGGGGGGQPGGQLGCLCDVKAAGGQRYYRLNDAKVLAWLRLKVEAAKDALQAAPGAAFSGMDDLGLTAYTAGLLGEYLSQAWQERLAAALGLPEELPASAHPPPQRDPGSQPSDKRPRLDPKEAAKAKAAEARAAAKQAKLAKEAQGMRKLSSFFAPRAAK